MAHNHERLFEVVVGERHATIPERCVGYHEKMTILLRNIINFEQEHLIGRTNIVVRIRREVEEVGAFLYNNRPNGGEALDGGSDETVA